MSRERSFRGIQTQPTQHHSDNHPLPIPTPNILDPLSLVNTPADRILKNITDMDAPQSSTRPRPSSRPTTPLRPSSRSSLREAHGYGNSIGNSEYTQPAINALEPQFAELADSMADLEANFMHLQLMHESLTRFSESFASFLYGLNMNAFCVDFPEVWSQTRRRQLWQW